MSEKILPNKDEDKERAKLPDLAKKLGFTFESDSSDAWISGQYEGSELTVQVERKHMAPDILGFFIKAPSSLVATIYHENFATKGSQALAAILSNLGVNAYCDIETGNEFIDENYFIEVDARHRPMMEALVADHQAVKLLEKVLRRHEQISFTGEDIVFYKYVTGGDLDEAVVTDTMNDLVALDRADGIYV